MTTFTLTTLDDTFTGGNGSDNFSGPVGGVDTLRGNGGNDIFKIESGQKGLIDGGPGQDQLWLVGLGNDTLDKDLKVDGIETLVTNTNYLYAKVGQIDGITQYDVNSNADTFYLVLDGPGGSLDFRTSFTEPMKLMIEGETADSALSITGSKGHDEIIGSDFNDTLFGAGGNDRIYGGFGDDIVGGGKGKDFLYGDDGFDSFLFNQKATPGNVDHIGDFRPDDDKIQIDDAVFKWAGQHLGKISASEFKVIGDGQSVDASDRILYNQDTGVLYFDADGAKPGGKAPAAFAIVDNFSGDVPVVTHHDIFVV